MLLHQLLPSVAGVLVTTNRVKRLKVRIHKDNVSSLDVYQSGRGVSKSLLGAQAHDVLDSLVKQFSGHNHAVSLAIVGNNFEYSSGRHNTLSVIE